MDKKTIDELIKAFELCKMAIEVLHPILDPDEPCIVYEAHEAASNQIARLKNLTSESSMWTRGCPKGGTHGPPPDILKWFRKIFLWLRGGIKI